MADVVGIGALNWDRLYVVDRFASAGEEIVIKEAREEAGGSAANTIAALGRLGVECAFIGLVGDDPEGRAIADAFEKEGVDTCGLIRAEGRTGTVIAIVDGTGERTMYVHPGVNDLLSPEHLDSGLIASARILHVSSFAGGDALETVIGLPGLMGGSKLSLAPGFLCQRGLDFLDPLVERAALLFLNEEEASALTGLGPEEAAELLLDRGVETVAITLGRRGALAADREGTVLAGAIETRVVDTTGAGDAFAAGFLYGVLKGLPLAMCAELGNFTASRCVGRVGARSGLPGKGDVEGLLKERLSG